jgi:hypothetical protein
MPRAAVLNLNRPRDRGTTKVTAPSTQPVNQSQRAHGQLRHRPDGNPMPDLARHQVD